MVFGAFIVGNCSSEVIANPYEHCDARQMGAESMYEHIKIRLDKLSERLEIKSSQLAAWDEYSKSVEGLVEPNSNRSKEDADAQTIARYRADRAASVAKKLSVIADATAKLQSVLTEDQRIIFNRVSRQYFHPHHSWHGNNHWQEHQGHEVEPHGTER
jgi:phage gp16-like protein